MRANKITEYLMYQFSDQELLDMAREQSRTIQEKTTLEKKKSELAKTLAGEIEGKQGLIDKLSECIRNGYAWRDIECVVQYDSPKPGMAEIVRTDTGEVAKTRRMTADELQYRLELNPEPEAETEEPGCVISVVATPEWRTADEIRDGVPFAREQ